MKKSLPALITLAFVACLTLPESARAGSSLSAGSIDLKYRVFVGGLEAGEVGLSIEHDGKTYHVKSEVRSLGLVEFLIRFRSEAFSKGRITDNIVRPSRHETHNMWRGDPRLVVITYGSEGPQQVEVNPEPEEDDRLPVEEEMKAATLDPLSAALVTSLSANAKTGQCNTSIPVFDGRRRYDIHMKGEEDQIIVGPLFSGPTYRCEMRIERIAGHSRNPWMQRQDDESGDVWFARLSDSLSPVPVRFEADIGMGALVIHLVHASGPGVNAKYSETRMARD